MLLFIPFSLSAQEEYKPGIVWIKTDNAEIIPVKGSDSRDADFAKILYDFNIMDITQPYWFAKTAELRKIYELKTHFSEDSLLLVLDRLNAQKKLFVAIEKRPVPRPVSEPVDYMWWLTNNDPDNDYLWYLQTIQAPLAWEITKGDTNVKVALTEGGLDPLHPDLVGKISPPYDFYYGTPLSFYESSNKNHGTSVATLIAAETTDAGHTPNGQMASIGYNTRIMYSRYLGPVICAHASTVLGADIISLSWDFGCEPYMDYLAVEQEILNNGTTIIRAAGNGPGYCNGQRLYPFSGYEDPRTIVVSSTGKDDRHVNSEECSGYATNSHYPEVDLCAPGYRIMAGTSSTENESTAAWPYYGCWGGTSQSTPIVTGTAALMYSVNPCLSSNWTQDILKNTTDPIADAANFPGMVGTGRLNAYKAVRAAQGAYKNTLDLYIKDRLEDFGYPNCYVWDWNIDKSPDIWVRNQKDGFTSQEHQEPEFSSSQPVYVYVRVWNKSCEPSSGQGNISLYWTKASTVSSWPQNWNGTQPEIGNKIATLSIPYLAPGESTVLEFEWNILNPYIHRNWGACLLARIEDISQDPITVYPNHLEDDIYWNNNIAMRNVTIVDVNRERPEIDGQLYPHGRFMFIGNATDEEATFDITFDVPAEKQESSIVKEAEVHIITDEEGWDILSQAVKQHPDIKVLKDREFLILSPRVTLQNIAFKAQTRIPIYAGFSFLTKENTAEREYEYRVVQNFSKLDRQLAGAEHFVIRKSARNPFYADAGKNMAIRKNETAAIEAKDIAEPADYNWYDSEGNLMLSSKSMEISPEITSKYKLEVVAGADGFKDYDDITVSVKQFWISTITPNPASAGIVVEYEIAGAKSACIMIMNAFGTISNNYILAENSNAVSINISGYKPGAYSVILIADGVATDAQTLIIQ
jgi:hypothetical protein